MSIKNEINEFLRERLNERLQKLTVQQFAVFWKVYPFAGIDSIPSEKLIEAIDLCDRTIKKNEEGRREPTTDI